MMAPLRMRRAVVITAVAAVAVVLTFVSIAPAAAHAVLIDTDPQDGQVLEEVPAQVTLSFNEPVQLNDGGVVVMGADGSTVGVTASAADLQVTIDLPPQLSDGTYIVNWRIISEDTHPVAGAFTFSIGAPSEVSSTQVPQASASVLDVPKGALQALIYLGIFLTAGLAMFELVFLVATRAAMPVLRRRLRRTALTSAIVAAVALVGILPVTAALQDGGGFTDVFSVSFIKPAVMSTSGLASLIALVGLSLICFLTPRTDGPRSWPRVGVHVGVGLALASLVLVGHTRTFGPVTLMLTSDILHVVAGSVWFGGLVGMMLMLAPSADASVRRAAQTVARFSATAAWLLLAVALTGLVLGWRILGSFGPLLSTWYGRTLLIKLFVVLVVVAAAAWNRFRLVPHIDRHTDSTGLTALRRVVKVEAILLAGALVVTGALVSQSPVAVPSGAQTEPRVVEVTLGNGTLEAHVSPGELGINALEMTLLDSDGETLEPMSDPVVELSLPEVGLGPLVRPVVQTAPGEYEATIDLPLAGSWQIEVSVRVSKYENPIATIPLEVQS